MSINKKTLLGRIPVELGVKDAVHTAIVSLRAGHALKPGAHIKMSPTNEAVSATPAEAFGIVDPFLTVPVARGTMFWAVLNMDEVPNVRHDWQHEKHSFAAPTNEVTRNKYLERYAQTFGITYDALMNACAERINNERQVPYSGPLSEEQLDSAWDNIGSDLWYEWRNESGHEFDNMGTECCPEYEYPDNPFVFVGQEPPTSAEDVTVLDAQTEGTQS